MKTCTSCNETKNLDEFQKRARNKDGLTNVCKVCKRAYDNAHYAANPERRTYIRSNTEARREEVKRWLWEYLSEHPCVDCGESDIVVLEFDHLEGKEMSISKMMNQRHIEAIKLEIAKCVVRCANDHRRKTAKTLGSWRMPG